MYCKDFRKIPTITIKIPATKNYYDINANKARAVELNNKGCCKICGEYGKVEGRLHTKKNCPYKYHFEIQDATQFNLWKYRYIRYLKKKNEDEIKIHIDDKDRLRKNLDEKTLKLQEMKQAKSKLDIYEKLTDPKRM